MDTKRIWNLILSSYLMLESNNRILLSDYVLFFCWFNCSCSTFYYIICCIYCRHIYMRLFSFWQRILLNFFCKTHINISFVFNGGHTNDPIKTKYSNNQLPMLKHTTIGCLWFHNLKLYPHFSWQTATKVCFERLHMMFFLVLIFIT